MWIKLVTRRYKRGVSTSYKVIHKLTALMMEMDLKFKLFKIIK